MKYHMAVRTLIGESLDYSLYMQARDSPQLSLLDSNELVSRLRFRLREQLNFQRHHTIFAQLEKAFSGELGRFFSTPQGVRYATVRSFG